jgi:uncharacterized protein
VNAEAIASHHATPVIPWWAGGLGIGLVLIVAVGLVQPIGVSTQYVVLDGVLLHTLLPAVAAQSPYLAETARGWSLATYEFLFVLGIPIGAFASAWVTGRFTRRMVPVEWERRLGRRQEQGWCGHSSEGFCSCSGHVSEAGAPPAT